MTVESSAGIPGVKDPTVSGDPSGRPTVKQFFEAPGPQGDHHRSYWSSTLSPGDPVIEDLGYKSAPVIKAYESPMGWSSPQGANPSSSQAMLSGDSETSVQVGLVLLGVTRKVSYQPGKAPWLRMGRVALW